GNLNNKSSDISDLADGAQEVNEGTGLLLSTLNEKSDDVVELSDGASELSSGASDLKEGAEELSAGASSAKSGSEELKEGLDDRLTPGSQRLYEGVLEAQEGVNETIDDMESLYAALELLGVTNPELQENEIYNMAKNELEEGLYGDEGADYKRESFKELATGAQEIR